MPGKHVQTFATRDFAARGVTVTNLPRISYLGKIVIWFANCNIGKREVVKAFGGVLNGLDGNFGSAEKGPKDERQDQPVLAFSI
jgi:hypothetical protein